MPQKVSIAVYDKMHRENLAKRAKKVQQLYNAAIKRITEAAAPSIFDAGEKKEFHFEDFPALHKETDALLQDLTSSLQANIEQGDKDSWTLANTKNDAMVDTLIGKAKLPKKTLQEWKHPHLEALSSFIDRKEEGMNLSKRVWNLSKQFKGELELALELGMGQGKSAAALSRDVRKYLKYPDKLFRRVRDKDGSLRLSKAASAFHPGRGVYRSSYKNALRMTATENNIAYRTADHNRWQNLPFVLGIEIHISNNHPIADICDIFDGKRFPKEFKFTGWHPWCRCYATTVLASQQEMDAYTIALMNGENVSDWKFTGKVDNMPEEFNNWLKNNQQRIASAKSMPYFIKDNFKNGDPAKGLRWESKTKDKVTISAKTSTIEKRKRHAARTTKEKDGIKEAWRERRLLAYDNRCDELKKTLTYSRGQTLPALEKRQATLREAIIMDNSVEKVEKLYARFERGVKIQNEWDTQVWGSFSQEQIAHMRKIEKSLGIKKGRPMTYEHADMQNANPNHVEENIRDKRGRWKKNPKYNATRDEPYSINCQTCAPAYDLRLKGFNVWAKGNTKGSVSDWISHQHSFDIYRNQDGTQVKPVLTVDWMKQKGITRMTPTQYRKYFEETCQEEGVYVLTIGWREGGGHATILQRFADGTLSYIEPQVYDGISARRDLKELYNYGSEYPIAQRGILRVDDKNIKLMFLQIFNK